MRLDCTPDTFEEWFDRFGRPHEEAVTAKGGTPWPVDPDKRRAVIDTLGVPEDIEPMELRRALWERRNRSAA